VGVGAYLKCRLVFCVILFGQSSVVVVAVQ